MPNSPWRLTRAENAHLEALIHVYGPTGGRAVCHALAECEGRQATWAAKAFLTLVYEGALWSYEHRGTPAQRLPQAATTLTHALVAQCEGGRWCLVYQTILALAIEGANRRATADRTWGLRPEAPAAN